MCFCYVRVIVGSHASKFLVPIAIFQSPLREGGKLGLVVLFMILRVYYNPTLVTNLTGDVRVSILYWMDNAYWSQNYAVWVSIHKIVDICGFQYTRSSLFNTQTTSWGLQHNTVTGFNTQLGFELLHRLIRPQFQYTKNHVCHFLLSGL